MKIGILTLPLHTNYGGILQAYALQTVLERMGHEVNVIERPCGCKPPALLWYKLLTIRFLRKLCGKYKGPVNVERFSARKQKVVGKLTSLFIEKHINVFHINKTLNHIKEDEFDAFVVGSDQIWRYSYTKGHFPFNEPFLDFAYKWKNKKRIAYAASFGTDSWVMSAKDTIICRNLIQKFDAVSVREDSGIGLCKQYLHYDNAIKLIDPTMLLDSNCYKELITQEYSKRGNVLCYILDSNERISNFISQFCKVNKWSFFEVNKRVDDETIPFSERIQPSVESWLAAFRDTDFVLTDSFHACVFSILFRKPFLVFCNDTRGSTRFDSLLSTFGLQDRIIRNVGDVDLLRMNDIDYDKVYIILQSERLKSHNFLSILNK